MVFMSAVTPAPDDGSNPAMVKTTGGVVGMWGMYRKLPFKQNLLVKAPFWVHGCTFVTFVEPIPMEGTN